MFVDIIFNENFITRAIKTGEKKKENSLDHPTSNNA